MGRGLVHSSTLSPNETRSVSWVRIIDGSQNGCRYFGVATKIVCKFSIEVSLNLPLATSVPKDRLLALNRKDKAADSIRSLGRAISMRPPDHIWILLVLL